VALWSVIALSLIGSYANANANANAADKNTVNGNVNGNSNANAADKNTAEPTCLEGSTEDSKSCQALPQSQSQQSWDSLSGLSPENALIEWIQSREHGSVASDKFRIETTEYPPNSFASLFDGMGEGSAEDEDEDEADFVKAKVEQLKPRFDFYATEDIPKGAVLMEIPTSAMIDGGFGTIKQQTLFEKYLAKRKMIKPSDQQRDHTMPCMLVERLVNEQEKGTDSNVHPYLRYIFGEGNPLGKQPIDFSEKGQFVFWNMMGQEGALFSPNKFTDRHRHSKACKSYQGLSSSIGNTVSIPNGNGNDASTKANRKNLEEMAFSYVTKHAWGMELIPLFDMIPHRNGSWKNIEAKFVDVESNETIEVMARSDRFETLIQKNPNNNNDNDNNNDDDDDDKTTDTKTKTLKLVVYAHRDIKAGEPLHVSYNQCEHLGCQSLQYTYDTGNLMADAGFVEEYPRRFIIELNPFEMEKLHLNFDLIFDIDVDQETVEKTLTKIKEPDERNELLYELGIFHSSKKRFNALKREVDHHTKKMELYEKNVIVDFHGAYQEAFALLWKHRNDPVSIGKNVNVTSSDDDDDEQQEQYDNLDQPAGPGALVRGGYMPCAEGEVADGGTPIVGNPVEGFYQTLMYSYEDNIDNTYMDMAGMLHSASNFRAHYHESAIHHPLQYVKDVKRVAYIGGGDNMVLDEVLKYPNLELVVGMELDQQACRSSLKYFGTTPAYHDPRVEWWYGNAAKTLQNIPDDYFASFDLVLVDLLNEVSEAIKVVVGLSLLEVAPLLVRDGGVIARNEDYVDRSHSSVNLAKRVIGYEFYDVPRLCEIFVTIGSNSVDFAKGERYDHGIDTKLRLKPFENTAHDGWAAYYDHSRPLDSGTNDTAWTSADSFVCDKIQRSLPVHKQHVGLGGGVLVVIEAEDVSVELNNDDSMSEVQKKISEVATRNGLSVIEHFSAKSEPNASFLVLNEGYIKAQIYPDVQYIAFDLMMWGTGAALEKSKAIQEDLITAMGGGSQEDSTSSYRITAGGMSMAEPTDDTNRIVDTAIEYYCDGGDSDVVDNDNNANANNGGKMKTSMPAVKEGAAKDEETVFDQSVIISEILGTPFTAEDNPSFVVFCGKEGTEECTSHDAIATNNNMTVHPIYSCESFDDMVGCKSTIEKLLLEIVTENKKIDGIILDRSVTLDMGKIAHKVFNNTLNQDKLLEKSFAVLTPIPTGESWRKYFVDRFRTEIIAVSPIMKADIDIYTEERSEEWSIVWAGHHNFFKSLEQALGAIEERTGCETTTKRVLPGSKPLKFDWNPRLFKDKDYYVLENKEQWFGQKPLAYQYLVQTELVQVKAPVAINETVLVPTEHNDNNAEFVKARVVGINDDKYDVEVMTFMLSNEKMTDFKQQKGPVDREDIRKFSLKEGDRKYTLGDTVLIPIRDKTGKEIPIAYYSAYVLGVTEAGLITRPKNLESDYEVGLIAHSELIMMTAESPEFSDIAGSLSGKELEEAFRTSAEILGFENEEDTFIKTFRVGKGLVVTLLSSKGSAAMKWDGLNSVELNVFAHENLGESLKESVKKFTEFFEGRLAIVAQDAFPRGHGRVVNFQHEIGEYVPHWIVNGTDFEKETYIYVDDDDFLDDEEYDE